MRARALGRQGGMSLLVVLVMLVVLTLFALSAINLSTSNLKVVGNMQARQANEGIALQATESIINSVSNFTSPTTTVAFSPATGTVTSTLANTPSAGETTIQLSTGYTLVVGKRECLFAAAATGYSAVAALAPEDTHWEYRVTVTETSTGASSVMRQGVKIRMLAGNCPA